jgi:hypothetical protein
VLSGAFTYAVEREIQDVDAFVRAVGASALVHGMSFGAVLARCAPAAGFPIKRLSMIEPPPFRVERAPPAPENYLVTVDHHDTHARPGQPGQPGLAA